jgi:hypothetical protein
MHEENENTLKKLALLTMPGDLNSIPDSIPEKFIGVLHIGLERRTYTFYF